jgi:lipopolysaccharide heptosyltransferase II
VKFDAKKILIILHGSIGDVTRALPLATLLRRSYPKARLAWAVEPAALPLVEHYPGLDEIILFDRRRWWRDLGPFLAKIRSRRFDLVLDLQRHLKSGVISLLSGAPHRIGFHRSDSKEFNWLFNNHFLPAVGDGVSKLDHYLRFAEYLGIETAPVEWQLALTESEQSAVDKHLTGIRGGFAVLFVGSRWESKRWFPEQIAECARLIAERHHLTVVLLGGRDDKSLGRESEELSQLGLTNLVGQTSLREAIGIVARAKIAVGPDTGLMHIAAAVGTPVVSLWGATSPERAGPHGFTDLVVRGQAPCAPCYLKRCPIGRICMRSIAGEDIATKIELAVSRGMSEEVHHVSRA